MVVLPPQDPAAIGVTVLTRRPRSRIVVVMNIRFWIMVWLCLFPRATRLWSADQSVAEKRRDYLLSGMRAEREKLRSGQVVITGEHWSNTTVSLGMMRFSVRFDVYFDHDTKSYRYTQRDYLPQGTRGMDPRWKTSLLARSELPRGTTPEGVEWGTTLKTELVHHEHYRPHAEARQSLFESIEVFDHRQRNHSAQGDVSPSQFAEALSPLSRPHEAWGSPSIGK